MNKSIYLILFAISVLWVSCSGPSHEATVAEIISSLKTHYAPDKRVALWEITFENGLLTGETNLPDALMNLVGQMEESGIPFQNQVNLLPDKELGDHTQALVAISVANIRSQPKHSAELATQALLGTPLNVLKKEGTWYLVQTPEGYISWVDAAGIALKSPQEMSAWSGADKLVYTEMLGTLFSQADKAQWPVSDLTAGNILKHVGEEAGFQLVELPDGRRGFVPMEEVLPYVSWLASRELSDENLIGTAKSMMGVPYLWGGTSPKGVDCSGFTKTVFFLNGMIIPRDASQQVNEGQEVDTAKDWENLEVGDLLFFGVPATKDSPERVVHVGMWIGERSFIHSRGRVRISSFDPDDENFDEYELNRYLRTKRIRNGTGNNLWKVNSLIQ